MKKERDRQGKRKRLSVRDEVSLTDVLWGIFGLERRERKRGRGCGYKN